VATAPATAAKSAPAAEPAPPPQEVDPHAIKALARALTPGSSNATSATAAAGAAPPPEARRFSQYIDRLHTAAERDQVVSALLDCVSELSECAALFVQQQKQLVCLDGRGPDHVVMGMKWFSVASEEQSPFNDVMASQKTHIGVLSDIPANRSAMASLSSSSGDLLLLPITVGNRSIGVLYADELKTDLKPLAAALKYIAQETGAALARIILQKKKSG
jgi:transcriptional regulator with GAF, ATPase, and Fis domain